VSYKAFSQLVAYLYKGEIEVEREEMTELYAVADQYCFDHLKEQLNSYLVFDYMKKGKKEVEEQDSPKKVVEPLIKEMEACEDDKRLLELFSRAMEQLNESVNNYSEPFQSLLT